MGRSDHVATEEPLEIRLRARGLAERSLSMPVFSRRGQTAGHKTVAITMRTPEADFELALGFLYGEGIIRGRGDVRDVSYCSEVDLDEDKRRNIVNVDLESSVLPDLETLERHFYTTSACGVCGKASLEALRLRGCSKVGPGPVLDPSLISSLPGKLREAQSVFATTGGLHAAALFEADGRLLKIREDVGRHNALDKLVGGALLEGRLPLDGQIVLVSGRSSFELLQKCLMAGVPVLCAVSAPSSLAVALARDFGITLVGFIRGERFNVYAGIERIRLAASDMPRII